LNPTTKPREAPAAEAQPAGVRAPRGRRRWPRSTLLVQELRGVV